MTMEMGANRYGKAGVRVVKVIRRPDGHVVRDLTVRVALEGEFADAHVTGDNTLVVATDTMKNTVYAFAKDALDDSIERYAIALADHHLLARQVHRVTVWVEQHAWQPIDLDGVAAPDAFARSGLLTRTATVTAEAGGLTVEAGIEDLAVMKTTKSAFAGFPRDRYTTLAEADDRIMATRVSATWRYGAADPNLDFDAAFEHVKTTFLRVFAEHFSPSVQNSIWIIGTAILDAEPRIDEIRFALPNLHHWVADLRPFGMENDREVYIATSEPHGLIEATVRRTA
jgi:urate oxidase